VSNDPQDLAAQDDAHLRSLGIKPQLNRSLGFLANFALAFSFISVSTGSYGNFGVAIGLGGPVMFWSWVLVIGGQLLVALVFAELASHFPVAGSIYQWSKRLSNRGLGWFTGWFYFWAQVVTVSAVAVIVAFAIDGFVQVPGFLDSPDPTGLTTMFTFIAITTLVLTTFVNAFGVRLLSVLNNIGVATEILGMLVFALILLFFANNQPVDAIFSFGGAEAAQNGNLPATFALGMFMALFVVYGFDTAGTFGEETLDASRQAPRGVLSSVLVSGGIGAVFLLAVILSLQSIPDAMLEYETGASPIATTILGNLSQELVAGITVGELYMLVILASVFVCTLAIQGAATRLMFSMGRDRHLPVGRAWGHVSPRFRTPANAAVAVGVLAAVPILLIGPLAAVSLSIAATGLIYLSYLMCNLGVLRARRNGWPRKEAAFNLGRWGTIVTVLAIVWGVLGVVNIGLWESTIFGDWGTSGRAIWNPFINTFVKPFGQELTWLPAWPLFESMIGLLLITGAIYYGLVVRRSAPDVEAAEADPATGEAIIG
jgi:amino acid transporter